MNKYILYLSIFTSAFLYSHAQEIQAKVTVNSSRIGTIVDKKIFNTLQTQLTNFINSRKWTNDKFAENEKIQCNFLINLESTVETNVYKANLIIQAARPVYNSTYQAALINFQDQDFTFKYIEYQPVEFNDNRVQGTDGATANLTAVFAFYTYMIIALDYDSFSPKGGDAYFQKAQNIINNAPENNNIGGWRAFDGLRNRYWLNENLVNSRNNILHDVIYSYYRAGLDKLYESDKEARANVLQTLNQLQAFNQEFPNTMFVDFFMQTKFSELVGIFKSGNGEEKNKAVEVLSKLDIANASRYKDELK
jgi:hypothetical protein